MDPDESLLQRVLGRLLLPKEAMDAGGKETQVRCEPKRLVRRLFPTRGWLHRPGSGGTNG